MEIKAELPEELVRQNKCQNICIFPSSWQNVLEGMHTHHIYGILINAPALTPPHTSFLR